MAIDVRKDLKKYLPHLEKAKEENLNEGDTVLRLGKVFEDVFGYDPMSEISRESSIKDRFVDIALKVEETTRLLVEVKSAATDLRHKHIEQAQNYAANANIPWVLLTNGLVWNLYHLTFTEGIDAVLAFTVDLEKGIDDKGGELLSLLHRQSVQKGDLDDYWSHRKALGPECVARSLFTQEALRVIRRDIRRREDILIDEEDLAEAIHGMFSTEAREQMGPLKIRKKAKKKAVSVTRDAAEVAPAPATSSAERKSKE